MEAILRIAAIFIFWNDLIMVGLLAILTGGKVAIEYE